MAVVRAMPATPALEPAPELLLTLSGLPIGPEVSVNVRARLRRVLWLVRGVAPGVGLLGGAIDGRAALAVLLGSGLAELWMRRTSALRALRARRS